MFAATNLNSLHFSIAGAVLVLGTAAPVFSQEEAAMLEPSQMVLVMADGTESVEYSVSDVSFYTSEIAGLEGAAPTTDLALSVGTISPLDQNLLQWAAASDGTATRKVVVTAPTGVEGEMAEMVYEFEGARVTSLSLSHTTYGPASISMQIVSEQVTINGAELQ
jgi:hypothetical protein